MKQSKITHYDPLLSVEENAANNNVKVAAMRAYIQKRGIDRSTDKQIYLYNKVNDYAKAHPDKKAPDIAKELDIAITANTVRKYLKMEEAPKPREKKVSAVQQMDKLHFLSVSDSQTSILKTILAIHLPKESSFHCDITAWKLGFYKDGLQRPKYCYDKYAEKLNNGVKDLNDFIDYWPESSLPSIVIDLPCSVQMPSTKSRFDVSTHFSSPEELFEVHRDMIQLAYRKLWNDGILVCKTMDFTYGNEPHWLSDEVLRMAKEIGFELIDKYIYIDPKYSKLDRRRKKYTTAIPAHAYFFVFKKQRRRLTHEQEQ